MRWIGITDKNFDEEFDEFVAQLQEEMRQKELEEYNEYIVDLFHDPVNWGKPDEEEITVEQKYQGPCGDTMVFYLKIKDNLIEKANYITDGCGASVATGSQTMKMINGITLEEAEKLTPEQIDDALHGLPEDHKHCAELAVRTLRRALDKYKTL